jgi:hypothetical protein
VSVHERGDPQRGGYRVRARNPADRDDVVPVVLGRVDDLEIRLGDHVDLIADGRVLADAAIEALLDRLAEQRNGHPSVTLRPGTGFDLQGAVFVVRVGTEGIGPDLGAHAEQLRITKRDPNEGADLTDAVG